MNLLGQVQPMLASQWLILRARVRIFIKFHLSRGLFFSFFHCCFYMGDFYANLFSSFSNIIVVGSQVYCWMILKKNSINNYS